MAITTLSTAVIEKRKKETIQSQNLRKVVPFREIELIDTSMIRYKDRYINITHNAFKHLLSMAGLSQSFSKKFDKLFSPEAKSKFVNTMKNAMASNSGKLNNVTLILNPSTRQITGITPGTEQTISNQLFIDLAERLIDKHNFDVTNWSTNPETGIVRINAFNPKAKFQLEGLSDEVFTGGISFSNSTHGGIIVNPYVNRMWCDNGMTTGLAQESFYLNSLDSISMERFNENLARLEANNFAPSTFNERVRAASNTHASIAEMTWAHNQISRWAGDAAEGWIPLMNNLDAYKKINMGNMTHAQMKGAKSNQSVWSVMNGLTHFATHGMDIVDGGMTESAQTHLMVQAGNFFGKNNFDHENHMPNPFGNLNGDSQFGALLN